MRRTLSTAVVLLAAVVYAADPPTPLKQAHAHNDYEHKRPLFDALDQGFCSVEADIFLKDGKLLVAHNASDLKPDRTLEALYLDPLRARVKANGGKVHPGSDVFWLLIDVKTEAKATCAAMHDTLARYADLFSVVRDGKFDRKAVTAVVSGNRDRDRLAALPVRYAGLDGRPADLASDAPAHLVPWISDSWGTHFKWKGTGPMPDAEKAKLREMVAKAHKGGRLLRFWGTPDTPAVWAAERDAGVDLINTDKLPELRAFLLGK
ncbi:MAG: phosphatidylinositol-specific phospholipase C/glycerophosphodiester phosphodiesterase family protein [Gemmataceae bacterium]